MDTVKAFSFVCVCWSILFFVELNGNVHTHSFHSKWIYVLLKRLLAKTKTNTGMRDMKHKAAPMKMFTGGGGAWRHNRIHYKPLGWTDVCQFSLHFSYTKENLVVHWMEIIWVPKPVWTWWRRNQSLYLPGNEPQPFIHRQSLDFLSYFRFYLYREPLRNAGYVPQKGRVRRMSCRIFALLYALDKTNRVGYTDP
jgi:hypothetical protein